METASLRVFFEGNLAPQLRFDIFRRGSKVALPSCGDCRFDSQTARDIDKQTSRQTGRLQINGWKDFARDT